MKSAFLKAKKSNESFTRIFYSDNGVNRWRDFEGHMGESHFEGYLGTIRFIVWYTNDVIINMWNPNDR